MFYWISKQYYLDLPHTEVIGGRINEDSKPSIANSSLFPTFMYLLTLHNCFWEVYYLARKFGKSLYKNLPI